jgi:hypothetical protein
VRDTVFRDHAGEALYVEEGARVWLDNVSFTGNGRGITVYSTGGFRLNDSTFAGNTQHVVIDLFPWSQLGETRLARNRFDPPTPTPARPPGILLRDAQALVQDSTQRTIHLESNRIEGAPIGLRAEGSGLVVLSTNDTLIDNAIGLSVQAATVRVTGGTFGNDRDIEGSGHITFDDVTYLRQGAVPPDAAVAGRTWVAWLVGGALFVLALGAFVLLRRSHRAPLDRSPPRTPASPLSPVPPLAPRSLPFVALEPPLTSVERRILEDIVAHPGTPQRAVADRLGTTRQALHYHVKKLEARGLVSKTVEGRETKCTVPLEVARQLVLTQTGSHEKA